MVDSVKSGLRSVQSSGTARSESLKQNFKSLSTGVRVTEKPSETANAAVRQDSARNTERIAKVVSNLSEAASFSIRALESLESTVDDNEETDVVRGFAGEVSKLRDDIAKVLEVLQSRSERASIVQENLSASDVRLRDLTIASDHAETTGSRISFNGSDAIEAHNNISPRNVAALLQE